MNAPSCFFLCPFCGSLQSCFIILLIREKQKNTSHEGILLCSTKKPQLFQIFFRLLLLLFYINCASLNSHRKYDFLKDISVEVIWENISLLAVRWRSWKVRIFHWKCNFSSIPKGNWTVGWVFFFFFLVGWLIKERI